MPAEENQQIRAFIAIAVDAAILDRLATFQQYLQRAEADVAWTQPHGMHLTLKFLGNIPTTMVTPIGDALAAIAARTAAFPIAVAGVGMFPNPQRPRVLWAGISDGAVPLQTLAGAVEEAMAALAFPAEERPWRAHLTLGRVKTPKNLPRLTALCTRHADETFGAMRVTGMALLQSELLPRGARYTTLREVALTGESSV